MRLKVVIKTLRGRFFGYPLEQWVYGGENKVLAAQTTYKLRADALRGFWLPR